MIFFCADCYTYYSGHHSCAETDRIVKKGDKMGVGISGHYKDAEVYTAGPKASTAGLKASTAGLKASTAQERGSRDRVGMCYDLLPPEAIRRLAETIKQGAEHYGKRNWEKGLDVNQLVDHAFDHLLKYVAVKLGNTAGMEGEELCTDHLAHALCNLAFACAIEERFPELGFK